MTPQTPTSGRPTESRPRLELIDLGEADGWVHFVNICDRGRDKIVVVNTSARNNLAVKKYGQRLDGSLEELGSRRVALWAVIPQAEVHVERNGYFGDEKKFELYNASKVRETVESRGGKSVTLPDLADRVADDIYVKRLSLSAAAKSLPIGNRAELGRSRRGAQALAAVVV